MLAALLLAGGAGAQSCSPPPGGPPNACGGGSVASRGSNGGPNSGVGNPINVITGNKYLREEDMPALPGVLGLEIVRHYNSAYSKPGNRNGPIGRGWRLSYETEVFDWHGKIQILQADGGRVIFERDSGSAGLCSTADPANGSMRIDRKPNGLSEYTWTWTNGRKLHFNTAGKLDRITAPTGETVDLLYDSSNVLVRVVDPQRRSLNLVYFDASVPNRFRGVQHIDSPVGRFSYEYGSELPKESGVFDKNQLLANLVRVRLPTSFIPDMKVHALTSRGTTISTVSRFYHHEDPAQPWLLTGISIETANAGKKAATTRFSTYGYDANGFANLSTLAGNVGKVTLDNSAGGKTVVTNSLGQKTVYLHALVAGEHRILEVRGPGCATCGETNVRYGYNAAGQLTDSTRLNENGDAIATTRAELDKLGRKIRLSRIAYHDGKPGPARLLERYEYQGSNYAPSIIARPSVVDGKEALTRIEYNAAGQPLSVTESGWAPAIDGARGMERIERRTSYAYATVNGWSLLASIDGPLPNGKSNGPLDSDITVFEYDHRSGRAPAAKSPTARGAPEKYEPREGLITAIVAPGSLRSSVEYGLAGRISAVTNDEGTKSTMRFSPRGLLLAVERGGITYSTSYDENDQPIESGYNDGRKYKALTRTAYDGAGRPEWTASSLGIALTRRFDTEGQLLEETTLSSTVRRRQAYAYDAFGRLASVTDANGATRHIGWSPQGLPDAFTDALGRTTLFGYDDTGEITSVTEAANTIQAQLHNTETRFALDVNGRPGKVTAPDGGTTQYIIDDFGRTLATISADSGKTIRRFDAADRMIASTDAKGNQAAYEFDAAGRIVRQAITPAGKAGVEQGGSVTMWRYEGTHLVGIAHPDQEEKYSYTPDGLVNTKTVILTLANGGKASYVTRYRYDALGQLAAMSLPDGSMLEYRRNGQDQVVSLERNQLRSGWLSWLMPKQSIVRNLERDAVELKRISYGNGIETLFQRSREGGLARIVHRDPRMPQPGTTLPALAGISRAGAAPAQKGPPGALGLAPDPNALFDLRYLWDAQGNLLHAKGRESVSNFAYDAQDHLIVATQVAPGTAAPNEVARFHYDGNDNRVLAQEGIDDQGDMSSGTSRADFLPEADRSSPHARYDANGQEARDLGRDFEWDALGRLATVRDGKRVVATYRYNHRGERIAKAVGGKVTYFLFEDRRLAAELDSEGRIKRQYIYLAGQPVAILDSDRGKLSDRGEQTWWGKLGSDMSHIWRAWFGGPETLAYLHGNHLGAIEIITDNESKPIWQAEYNPFGKVISTRHRMNAKSSTNSFEFNLRLPGQYEDRETGLYYNDRRYYDPSKGRYLTPDPTGLKAGTNSYVYVRGNPLKYVDPSGLILFAFDGTDNSAFQGSDNSLSNVRKFYLAYDQKLNGDAFYITGIGTTDLNMPNAGNRGTGEGFDDRVNLGFTFLDRFIHKRNSPVDKIIDIDVIGFSRGAAEARVWMNLLIKKLNDGNYVSSKGVKRCLNLRFMGLWDTVPHLGAMSEKDKLYDFSVSPSVKHVVQAIALNEHRGGVMSFHAWSIFSGPSVANSGNRIEQGFVGSHSDVGGGFGTGDLSDVALMWMFKEAGAQGVKFKEKLIKEEGWDLVSSPILHDKSENANYLRHRDLLVDRDFIYGPGGSVRQANATVGGANTKWARSLVSYYDSVCGPGHSPAVGSVKMGQYAKWLSTQGIPIRIQPSQGGQLCR